MVVPVAAAQQITRGFKATIGLAMVFGVVSATGGLYAGFERDLSPGPAIVLLALAVFIVAVTVGRLLQHTRTARSGRAEAMRAVDSGAEVGR
jgi:zinc transport system permease protein